jgi:pyrroline-5-carboxylate reductase
MGVAVVSGTIASLESRQKLEDHTSGTAPIQSSDPTLPSRFLACVNREESIKRVQAQFRPLGVLGEAVEIFAKKNVEAVRQADVVLLR